MEAATARGLLSDNQYVWRHSAKAAMEQIRSLKQRVHWMAIFLASNRPLNPLEIVQDNLHYLSPMRLPDGMRQDYFLRRLECILRYPNYIAVQDCLHAFFTTLNIDFGVCVQQDLIRKEIGKPPVK